jgi:hypothetical protein
MTNPKSVNASVTPTSTNKTVTIPLPPGMTEEEYLKLFGTFEKVHIKGKAIGRAEGRAVRRLLNAHKDELLALRKEEWKKEGLDPSKLTVRK